MEFKANESDQNTNDSSNYEKKTYQTKKSAKIVSKTLFISKEKEELINNLMRKYSYDPKLYIKNFVPVLRPKENDTNLIPSKLILNIRKRKTTALSNPSSSDNENNTSSENEELNLSNSFVNSVISDSSSEEDDDEIQIQRKRKNFTRIRKSSIYRNISKKNLKRRKTGKISLDLNLDDKIKSDYDLYNNKKESYDSFENIKKYTTPKKSCIILSSLKKNDTIFNQQKKKRDRINSFSILETLQNKLKFDK